LKVEFFCIAICIYILNFYRNPNSYIKFSLVATVEGTNVTLTSSGTGGLSELVSLLKEDQCQYGYLRVISGDSESRRAKFVFISWVGEKVGALKRAKTSVQKAEVKKVIRDFTVEVHGETLDELDESALMTKVRKAGGAGNFFILKLFFNKIV
jgi:hypothetical protein